MPLNLFYTMVQKRQKWPKTQIKGGGPALMCMLLRRETDILALSTTCEADPV